MLMLLLMQLMLTQLTHNGVHEGQSAVGASYAMGDLVVSVGKQNLSTAGTTSPDALVSATYTMTADALTIVAQADNAPSGDYQLNMTYALAMRLVFHLKLTRVRPPLWLVLTLKAT